MTDYVEETTICRSRYLLGYFGQTETEDCGTCDVCRSAKTGGHLTEERIRAALEGFLDRHPDAGLEQVRAFVNDPAAGLGPEAMEVFRSMMEEIKFG